MDARESLFGHGNVKVDAKVWKLTSIDPVYGTVSKEVQPNESIRSTDAENPTAEVLWMDIESIGEFRATAETRMTTTVTAGGVTVPVPFPVVGPVDFGVTPTQDHTDAKMTRTTTIQTFAQKFHIPIDPHTQVKAELFVRPVKYTQKFTALVEVSGSVHTGGILGFMTRSVGLGTLFTDYGNSQVHVQDANTIRLQIAGEIVGIVGEECLLVPTMISLEAKSG